MEAWLPKYIISRSSGLRCVTFGVALAATRHMSVAGPPDEDLVLRANSRLVQVSVVAQDKHGDPVPGLRREDFSLTSNGHAQAIAVFSEDVAEPIAPAIASAAPADPLTIANRVVHPTGKQIPVTVILFDALNIDTVDDFLYGKRELVKFLQTLGPGDPVALYSLNGPQVRVIHDFTDSTDSLIASVKQLAGTQVLNSVGSVVPTGAAPSVAPGSGAALQNLSAFLAEGSRADESALLRLRAEWTLSALENVAHHLSGISGRKNLVWISGAFPMSIGVSAESFASARQKGVNEELFTFSDRVSRLAKTLMEAEVAVYPVDPGALRVDPQYRAALPKPQANALVSSKFMLTEGVRSEPFHRTMDIVAKETGGKAFFNANDVSGSIRRAVDDSRVTYTLGFYPSESDWDGKYHSLHVKVNRADIQVRARSGYLATSEATEAATERDKLLRLATASPLEGAAIGLKVHVQSNPLEWSGQEMVVAIDPHDVRFVDKLGLMVANVDVVFVQQTRDGRTIKGEKKTLGYSLPPESYKTALAEGLFLKEQITVEAGADRVRIAALDPSTGAIGSVSIPVRAADKKGAHQP